MKILEHESISLGIIYTMLIWGISTIVGHILRKKGIHFEENKQHVQTEYILVHQLWRVF
jgi:hypothetical protein